MVADVQIFEGRSLDIISQAESLGSYGAAIVDDYPRYTAASVMVETADKVTESEGSPQQYLLLVGALRSLSRKEHEPVLTLDSYLLRALSLAGWAPSFESCAKCGTEGIHGSFVVQLGGMVCSTCAPVGAARIDAATVDLLDSLLTGDWDRAEGHSPVTVSRGSAIVSAYAQFHLERGLRSMEHVAR
jgi:DNA repair protein RecO (recombination protein O)